MRTPGTIILTILLCLSAATAFGQSSGPTTRPLNSAEELELKTYATQLTDSTRDLKTKTDAAELLLTRPYPQAWQMVRTFLADATNPSAQIAIADAMTRQGGRKEYVEPLMAMLAGVEPTVRAPAACALASYKDQDVTRQLIDLAQNPKNDKSLRVVVISSLQRVLDKAAVAALVELLDDGDANVRDAAADSLAKLTNNTNDRSGLKAWWEQNKDRSRNEWLADLADSLSKTKAVLEADNVKLRERLAKAVGELHGATVAAGREAMLLSLLKDPLPDVRLAAVGIIRRKIESGTTDEASADLRAQVRLLLGDADDRVRESAALVLANLNDADTVTALLNQFKVENSARVQCALLAALGQLRDAKALPSVLVRLNSRYDSVCAAAAAALGRIAANQPLQGPQRGDAVRALIDRYHQIPKDSLADDVGLREALLDAMGNLSDKEFLPVLKDALKDTGATVRRMAVNGLAKINDPLFAELLVPLMADTDRGVTIATIAALGNIGGEKYLDEILKRTAAANDDAVRKQAWDSALAILANSNYQTLGDVCDRVAQQPESAIQYLQVMGLLVEKLKVAKSPSLAERQRQFAAALIKAERPNEASAQLADVYAAADHAKPQTNALWAQWVECMLAADDPSVAKVLVGQNDSALFDNAIAKLQARLDVLVTSSKHAAAVGILEQVVRELASRLTAQQNQSFSRMLADCRLKQAQSDQQRVAKLATQLLVSEESASKAAATELATLGDRAIRPLIGELRKNIASTRPSLDLEKALLASLRQLAPKLIGYDSSAPMADRMKVLDSWVIQATTRPQ